jgi:serine protease Do
VSQTAATFDPGGLVDLLRDATVEIHTERGHGAGVRWPVAGVIATCSHVVAGAAVAVRGPGGREHRARLLLDEPDLDVALLMIDEPWAGEIQLRREPLRPGELLFAMGNPWGEARVLTAGVAIAPAGDDRFIAADLRVVPGNSGGPLVDSRGRLAGIVSMHRGGAAIAIAAAEIERLAARLDGAPGSA